MVWLGATAEDVLSAMDCDGAAPDHSLSRQSVWKQGAGCQRVRIMARLQQTQLLCGMRCRRRAELYSLVKFEKQHNELSLRSSVALFLSPGKKPQRAPASARCCSHKGNMQEDEIKMLEKKNQNIQLYNYTTIDNISSQRENILQKNICLVRNKWQNVRKQLHLHRLVSDYYLFNNRFFFFNPFLRKKSRYAIKTLPHQKARVQPSCSWLRVSQSFP